MIEFCRDILNTLKKWFPVAFAGLTAGEELEYLEMLKRLVHQSCRSVLALDVAPVEISFHRNYNGVKYRVIDRMDEEGKTAAIQRLDMFGDVLLASIKILPAALLMIFAKWSSPDGR